MGKGRSGKEAKTTDFLRKISLAVLPRKVSFKY